jgi:hypothetical protein
VSNAEKTSRKSRPRSLPRRENPRGAPDLREEAKLQILKLLLRIERLSLEINVAFGDEPSLPGLSPTCPANRRRFEAFLDEQLRVARLIHQLVDLYLTTFGPEEEGPSSDRGKESKIKMSG